MICGAMPEQVRDEEPQRETGEARSPAAAEQKLKEDETQRKHEIEKLQLQAQMASNPSENQPPPNASNAQSNQTLLPGKSQKEVKMNLVADQVFD